MPGKDVEPYAPLVLHAVYYLAEAAGWRSGLRWQLRGGGVYSPDLQRLLVAGKPPRPPREALERVRALIRLLCGGNGVPCGMLVVLAAKLHALEKLGLGAEALVAPEALRRRVRRALAEAGLAPRGETIITPKPVAH
jgi:hypothetical protein